jgi:hypothetical protein
MFGLRNVVAAAVIPTAFIVSASGEHPTLDRSHASAGVVGAIEVPDVFTEYSASISRLGGLPALTGELCRHECRTDYCTAETAHDIVQSANPDSEPGFQTELEECGEHDGETCAWHECELTFAGGLDGVIDAINELRSMPAAVLMAAVTIIPELDMDPSGRFAQLIGCAGRVVANVPIPAD